MIIIKTIENSKKTKLTWTALLIMILLMIASCAPKAGSRPEAKPEPSPSGSRIYRIAMSQSNFSDSWRVTQNEEMKAAVKKYPELELTILNGARDNSKQNSDLLSLIEADYDAIMVAPNEAKPLTAVIQKAYDKGIPVILIDRKSEGNDYTQYIGGDNRLIGKMAGEWVLKKLGDAGGNVVEIMGLIGTSAQIERHEGFVEAISANPNIKILSSKPADWTRDKAITVMEDMLKEFSKIDIVFAHNDFSALGAYTAAENAGREDEMAFIGVDGLLTPDGGIVGIMEGKIDATFFYPTGGKEAIESCYKLLVKGEPLEKEIKLGTIEITRDNVQSFIDVRKRQGYE